MFFVPLNIIPIRPNPVDHEESVLFISLKKDKRKEWARALFN